MIVIGVLVPGAPRATTIAEIARRAAGTGARTEVVGVAPTGSVGDRQLFQLAAAGVGHATVTRSGVAGIEPADLELALRYLPDIRAIVLVDPGPLLLATASTASAWSGAPLIVVADTDEVTAPTGAAPKSVAATELAAAASAGPAISLSGTEHGATQPIVLRPPTADPDGAFAGLVAALAVRLEAGDDPAAAWQSTLRALAVDPA